MNVEARELRLWLDFEPGSQFVCLKCGKYCPGHDTGDTRGIWIFGNIAPNSLPGCRGPGVRKTSCCNRGAVGHGLGTDLR
jgi:hypothetical protein